MSDRKKKKEKKLLIILGVLTLVSVFYNTQRTMKSRKSSKPLNLTEFEKNISLEMSAEEVAKVAARTGANLGGKNAQNPKEAVKSIFDDMGKSKVIEDNYSAQYQDDNFETKININFKENDLERIRINSRYLSEFRISDEDLIGGSTKPFWIDSFEVLINLRNQNSIDNIYTLEGKEIAKVYVTNTDSKTRVAADLHYKIILDLENLKANVTGKLIKNIVETDEIKQKFSYRDRNSPSFIYVIKADNLDLLK